MTADQSMWTPLESALAPFKELARINRPGLALGRDYQLVLSADRCKVQPAPAGNEPDAPRSACFSLGSL
jgi:hypothetical protein